jgi:hypothetical protein
VLNPVVRLHVDTRYRVVVGPGIVDRGGNRLKPRHWTFTTGS